MGVSSAIPSGDIEEREMIINAVIFGLVVAVIWVGLKVLWSKGKIIRIIVVCLSAPILIWVLLLIVKIIGAN